MIFKGATFLSYRISPIHSYSFSPSQIGATLPLNGIKLKYLSNFENNFENNLGYVSGAKIIHEQSA
jgi:hypothetical protein